MILINYPNLNKKNLFTQKNPLFDISKSQYTANAHHTKKKTRKSLQLRVKEKKLKKFQEKKSNFKRQIGRKLKFSSHTNEVDITNMGDRDQILANFQVSPLSRSHRTILLTKNDKAQCRKCDWEIFSLFCDFHFNSTLWFQQITAIDDIELAISALESTNWNLEVKNDEKKIAQLFRTRHNNLTRLTKSLSCRLR